MFDISNSQGYQIIMIKLDQAQKRKTYKIIAIDDCDIKARLIQLGFHENSLITLKRKAPIFGNPLLFDLEDSQIALTKSEAFVVQVEEVNG